ncbi:MAG TPA: TetR/AcrR family transcriptional regulator [Polyangiaceae bacterium]|jgi:AcrR family transcriptional regulator
MKTQPLRVQLREATWSAILDAAERVAAEEGSTKSSLQAIAQSAGIAVGTIYNYFDDKQKLFDALFAKRREELYDAIDEEARAHARAPFREQLDAYVRAVFSHFDARRDFLRIALESESLRPQIVKGKGGAKQPAMQQLQERAERVMRIGIKEGALREDGAELLAILLVSLVRGMLVARSAGEQPFLPETERVVSLFLHGASR